MRRLCFVVVLSLATVGFLTTANAGDPDYVVRCSDGSGGVGDEVTVTVGLDINNGADGIRGYQFGLCHDFDLLDITITTAVTDLPVIADLNDGDGPDFQTFSGTDTGWNVGVIFSLMDTDFTIDEGGDIYEVTYDLLEIGTADLTFCGDGLFPEELAVVTGTGDVEPSVDNGVIQILGPWSFTIADASGSYDPDDGTGPDITTTICIQEDDGNVGAPNPNTAFQCAVSHDDTYLTVVSVDHTGVLSDLDAGDGPAFFQENLDPAGGPGFTVGVLYDFQDLDVTIDYDGGCEDVLTIAYELNDLALADEDGEILVDLTFDDTLGSPVLPNSIIVDGTDTTVNLFNGVITLSDIVVGGSFKRGNVDGNGVTFALIDALFLLSWAFTGGDTPPCMDAADVDGNNTVFALIDALYLLSWAFTGGDAPPDPGPSVCGPDNDDDGDSPDCETDNDGC